MRIQLTENDLKRMIKEKVRAFNNAGLETHSDELPFADTGIKRENYSLGEIVRYILIALKMITVDIKNYDVFTEEEEGETVSKDVLLEVRKSLIMAMGKLNGSIAE